MRVQLAFVQELAPHVRRAVRLQRMLGHERRRAGSAEGALDALSVDTLLLDRQGRLVHANTQGERLLRNGHGLRLRNGQAVFAKTGVHRQVNLVRLLAGAPWKLTTPDAPKEMES